MYNLRDPDDTDVFTKKKSYNCLRNLIINNLYLYDSIGMGS